MQKKTANNAFNWVTAKNCEDLKAMSNLKFIENICEDLGQKLLHETDINIFGESEFFCFHIIPKLWFKNVIEYILNAFIYGEHKKRWVGLMGPYGSGKSTFANGIRELFKGTVIDVNVDKSRLNFFWVM